MFRGKVLFEGLSVYDKENNKMAGIRQLFVDVRLKPVFSGKYEIDSLIIIGLDGNIDSEQIKSFMPKDEKKESKPLNLIIKNIKIVNTDIKYKDIDRSVKYGFKNNKITATVNVKNVEYYIKLNGSEIKELMKNFKEMHK